MVRLRLLSHVLQGPPQPPPEHAFTRVVRIQLVPLAEHFNPLAPAPELQASQQQGESLRVSLHSDRQIPFPATYVIQAEHTKASTFALHLCSNHRCCAPPRRLPRCFSSSTPINLARPALPISFPAPGCPETPPAPCLRTWLCRKLSRRPNSTATCAEDQLGWLRKQSLSCWRSSSDKGWCELS